MFFFYVCDVFLCMCLCVSKSQKRRRQPYLPRGEMPSLPNPSFPSPSKEAPMGMHCAPYAITRPCVHTHVPVRIRTRTPNTQLVQMHDTVRLGWQLVPADFSADVTTAHEDLAALTSGNRPEGAEVSSAVAGVSGSDRDLSSQRPGLAQGGGEEGLAEVSMGAKEEPVWSLPRLGPEPMGMCVYSLCICVCVCTCVCCFLFLVERVRACVYVFCVFWYLRCTCVYSFLCLFVCVPPCVHACLCPMWLCGALRPCAHCVLGRAFSASGLTI